jgi:hypothetical protein
MSGDRTLKLADFGLSITMLEERPVTRVGTLEYMVRPFGGAYGRVDWR